MKTTIHILGYGETQIISKDINFKTATSDLATAQAVIDDVKSKKPSDKDASNFHVINIFDENVNYQAKLTEGIKIKDDNGSFSFGTSELDLLKLNALISELTALKKQRKESREANNN